MSSSLNIPLIDGIRTVSKICVFFEDVVAAISPHLYLTCSPILSMIVEMYMFSSGSHKIIWWKKKHETDLIRHNLQNWKQSYKDMSEREYDITV